MFLDDILTTKREEVLDRRRAVDIRHLQDLLIEAPTPRPFAQALRRADGRLGLIAEIKKASPSAGVIQPNFDPIRQAKIYEDAGADCLSILTDEQYFQGHLDYLRDVRRTVSLPCLRKDFIIDTFQIYEARTVGADAVLLIVAALDQEILAEFTEKIRALGMEALVEVHTEQEMETALEIGASLIGINSRNLKTFEVDLAVVERVAALAPSHITLIGESGIKTRTDVERLKAAGATGVLVGETLMRSGDVASAVRALLG